MEETTEQTKNEVRRLRKEDPTKWTYKAIKEKTGIKQDSTITKILKQDGQVRSRASPQPQASESKSTSPTTPPAPTPTATTPPVQPTPGDGVSDLQPPEYVPRAKPKAHPQQFNCSECRVPFVLDPGEKIEDVKACPSCGESFE